MKEGHQSPVFKKRFARRKTTTRPFTFAYNFETENTSAAQNQIVKQQVGDRGVVITTSVPLNESNEGLSISDIVQSSPVPVLIAHTSPKDNQKDVTNYAEDDQLETSFCRRSGRSRQPSDSFLARLQHPHGKTPMKSLLTPDTHYIGSKNDSNIDEEVSFTDENEPTKRGRQKLIASSGSPTKAKSRITQSSVNKTKQNRHETSQTQGVTTSSKKKGQPTSADAGKQVPTPNHASQRTGKGKEKEQPVLSRTILSSPVKMLASTTSSRKAKKSALPKPESPPTVEESQDNFSGTKESNQSRTGSRHVKAAALSAHGDGGDSSAVRKSKPTKAPAEKDSHVADVFDEEVDFPVIASVRRRKGSAIRNVSVASSLREDNSVLAADTTDISASASSKRRKNLAVRDVSAASGSEKNSSAPADHTSNVSISASAKNRKSLALENESVSKPGKKRGIPAADMSDMSVSTPHKKQTSLAIEQKSSRMSASTKVSQGRAVKNSTPAKEMNKAVSQSSLSFQGRTEQSVLASSVSATASGRRKRTAVDNSLAEMGPSSEKRKTLTARSSSSDKEEAEKKTNSSQSGKRKSKIPAQANVSTQNSSRLNTKTSASNSKSGVSATPSVSQPHASPARPGNVSQKSCQSPRRFFEDPGRSPEKLVTNKIIGIKNSPRKGIPRSASSFWKTTRRIDSELRPAKPPSKVSVSTVYDDDTFGDPNCSKKAVQKKGVDGNGVDRASRKRHHDVRPPDDEEKNKGRKAVTELDVIIKKMDEIEAEMMEEPRGSKVCKTAVHKAFTFTRKQLLETVSQLTEIKELTSQIKKLKHQCKSMSNESRENHDQKCILLRELQSLQDRGIDSDMMCIDKWMHSFQALRQNIA